MKDKLGDEAVQSLAQVLTNAIDDFPAALFIKAANQGLDQLELKQRVDHLIRVLADYLPTDFTQAATVLLAIKTDRKNVVLLHDFTAWPLVDYVAVYGLAEPTLSLRVLKSLTSLFSAEFAIRPFIEQHFELTYQVILTWCDDRDEHVRRLASEGIRPRLPWGRRLTRFCKQPDLILPILEQLKDDDSLYVRRSVANNLNDIAKDNPDKVIALCQHWSTAASIQRQWLIRHALRGLIKSGRADVFPLLGYTATPSVQVDSFILSKAKLHLGDNMAMTLVLQSNTKQPQKLVVDYQVHHLKANGQQTSKVFKWKNISLGPEQRLELTKHHAIKQITTRQYYPGMHSIALLINGQVYEKKDFELVIT